MVVRKCEVIFLVLNMISHSYLILLLAHADLRINLCSIVFKLFR